MPIQVNAIYINSMTYEEFRVLCLFPHEDSVAVIALGKGTTLPYYLCLSNVEDDISAGEIHKKEAIKSPVLPNGMDPVHIDNRNKKLELIKSFVMQRPECFMKQNWSNFISNTAKEKNLHRMTIQRYLYQYWALIRNNGEERKLSVQIINICSRQSRFDVF